MYLIKRLTRELWPAGGQDLEEGHPRHQPRVEQLAGADFVARRIPGRELARQGDGGASMRSSTRSRIRARHLHGFIHSYAEFSRLPQPRPEASRVGRFSRTARAAFSFVLASAGAGAPGWFDRVQLEQVLINLLKNAHESGGAPSAVEIEVGLRGNDQRIEVRDRGAGMSETVLANALLPFLFDQAFRQRPGSGTRA
jgi:hypothetical protein